MLISYEPSGKNLKELERIQELCEKKTLSETINFLIENYKPDSKRLIEFENNFKRILNKTRDFQKAINELDAAEIVFHCSVNNFKNDLTFERFNKRMKKDE